LPAEVAAALKPVLRDYLDLTWTRRLASVISYPLDEVLVEEYFLIS
jgi:hypothetical protein